MKRTESEIQQDPVSGRRDVSLCFATVRRDATSIERQLEIGLQVFPSIRLPLSSPERKVKLSS